MALYMGRLTCQCEAAKHKTSINKRTILTTCNKVWNENSKVNIRVKTFTETGVVYNASKYVK